LKQVGLSVTLALGFCKDTLVCTGEAQWFPQTGPLPPSFRRQNAKLRPSGRSPYLERRSKDHASPKARAASELKELCRVRRNASRCRLQEPEKQAYYYSWEGEYMGNIFWFLYADVGRFIRGLQRRVICCFAYFMPCLLGSVGPGTRVRLGTWT